MGSEREYEAHQSETHATFAESMESFDESCISVSSNVPAKKKRSKGEIIFFDAFFVICIAVFLVCAFIIGRDLIQKYTGENFYQQLVDDFFNGLDPADLESDPYDDINPGGVNYLSAAKPSYTLPDYETALNSSSSPSSTIPSAERNRQLAAVRAKLNSMKLKNDEIFGVIKVEGTSISYALVRHDDNDFYLTHSTEKKPLVIGSIFLDYRNTTVLAENYNSILYGHNMTSGSMFHDIELFDGSEELFNESVIYVYTMEGIYIYKPFSYYRTIASNDYIRTYFASGEEFVNWANNVKSRSAYESDYEFSEDDQILTLSTCINYSYNNEGRYALHAVLVEVISEK